MPGDILQQPIQKPLSHNYHTGEDYRLFQDRISLNVSALTSRTLAANLQKILKLESLCLQRLLRSFHLILIPLFVFVWL